MGGISRANLGVGIDQTWQTVARSSGTTYQNTSGKPIEVMVEIAAMVGSSGGSLSAGGTAGSMIALASVSYYGTAGIQGELSLTVPHGHFYKIDLFGGATIPHWSELR